MVATHIEKIKHSVLCVTGVYLKDITNMIFVIFECELSEHLLIWLLFIFIFYGCDFI